MNKIDFISYIDELCS